MYRGIYNGKKRHVEDIDQVIQRAKSTGVTGLIITGGTLKESEEALQLAQKYDGAYCTVGCHPTRVGEFEIMREKPTMEAVDNNPDEEVGNEKEKREQLRENNARKYLEGLKTIVQKDLKNETGKIVAIGECGRNKATDVSAQPQHGGRIRGDDAEEPIENRGRGGA
ncbi:putative deoxyribonuclease TATDN1 [Zancudomyces culisetae]|uniref:Putative deoxyribonuclease TATDN1 n=1 Tax=Zancudomyces culisetae TaxID=1213189 RepID=A0A1R1PBW1_ZANCU|nr:putative deoxyribonuclease TATDN1 [Zancudomyces culisetae]|eukprot:OMH78443.1 putative deoxyribonuclease TATDN1 [Zancudomyces culisetae]